MLPRLSLLALFPVLLGPSLLPAEVTAERVYENLTLTRPLFLTVPPDGTGREFLVEQGGLIRILPEDRSASEAATFLDISDRALDSRPGKFSEEGLLGLAFHPEFKENKTFYLYYSLQDPKRSVVSEMKTGNGGMADVETERVLLEVPQPFWNHNSGNIAFGPDGMLYIALGDGGKSNDLRRLAQNPFLLNGKILRINVDARSGDLPYGIPEDNPFVGAEGTREEIWATGLRNPWGVWFDPDDGKLWCADVGQNLWEEVNVIEKGKNYGWSHREGRMKFDARTDEAPEGTEFAEPIHVYDHTVGLSISGGYVYRGESLPSLSQHYLYSDFVKGWIGSFPIADGESAPVLHYTREDPKGSFKPTAVFPDSEGEPLILSWDGVVMALREK